jgi:hypothetical protein
MSAVVPDAVTVADLVAAVRGQRGNLPEMRVAPDGSRSRELIRLSPQEVLVIGAHPGAGATTVAVAVADVLAGRDAGVDGLEVYLVDGARPESSGMGAAVECAVGGREHAWRAGRRGGCMVLRPVVTPASATAVPALAATGPGWAVVDAGWPLREVMAGPGALRTLVDDAGVVVVCRASVPGVRQVERALDVLPRHPVVAAVGARRWPAAARASFGPQLSRVMDEGRAVLVPTSRRVEINGIDTEALPGSISGAAARLVELLRQPRPGRRTEAGGEGVSR